MRYQHPDLAEITKFLLDFGMVIAKQTEDKIWFRGYSTDQYVYYAQRGPRKFMGGTYEVETFADLEKASCCLAVHQSRNSKRLLEVAILSL